MDIEIIAASIEQSTLSFPLGSLAIYVALKENRVISGSAHISHSHYFIDTHDPVEAAQSMAERQVDLLGLSIYLFNRTWMNTFLQAFLTLSPSTTVFAGGPETIAHPHDLLDAGCAFLIQGEGEMCTQEAVEKWLRGEQVEGSGIFTKDSRRLNSAYPQNLSTLPSIILHPAISLDDYPGVLWEFTRGCPYNCAFCFESKGSRLVRTYDLNRIERELDYLIEQEISRIFVLDPTFNMTRNRTIEILELLIRKSDPAMHYTFEIRAELLDSRTASLFGELHCSLQIGLQSSNTGVLNTINRSFEPDLFSRKIGLLQKHNVVFGLDLIIGLPGDTCESFFDSVDYAVGCRPSNIDIFLLSLLPGTEVYDKRDTFALQYQSDSPYELIESTTMNEKDILKALKVKHGCDIFYTKGNAVMWFHHIVETLQMKASQFFLLFDQFMENEKISDEDDTYRIQDMFITYMFKKEKKEHLLPVILSYIEMHQGISYYQETLETPVVTLWYDPEDLAFLDTHSALELYQKKRPNTASSDYLLYGENGRLFFERFMD